MITGFIIRRQSGEGPCHLQRYLARVCIDFWQVFCNDIWHPTTYVVDYAGSGACTSELTERCAPALHRIGSLLPCRQAFGRWVRFSTYPQGYFDGFQPSLPAVPGFSWRQLGCTLSGPGHRRCLRWYAIPAHINSRAASFHDGSFAQCGVCRDLPRIDASSVSALHLERFLKRLFKYAFG